VDSSASMNGSARTMLNAGRAASRSERPGLSQGDIDALPQADRTGLSLHTGGLLLPPSSLLRTGTRRRALCLRTLADAANRAETACGDPGADAAANSRLRTGAASVSSRRPHRGASPVQKNQGRTLPVLPCCYVAPETA
jgi:hypothetical protein